MTKKIIAILSSVLLLGSTLTPVLAIDVPTTGTTIQDTANGSGSVNVTNFSTTNTTQVTQTNDSNIHNNVDASANTGDITATHNTGGDVNVETGAAKTQVSVANNANSNVANVSGCNCNGGNFDVKTGANGADSVNTQNIDSQNTIELGQSNASNIENDVKAKSNTGKVDAGFNTGGTVSVMTGNGTTNVGLMTNANQNLAQVGSGNGGAGSTTSALIEGNGSGSINKLNLGLTDWIVSDQTNDSNVENLVNASANTGKVHADFNTGGSVLGDNVEVATGNATTAVTADTAVNFNQAAIGCDCLMGVTAKIAGNGASDGWWNQTTDVINASLVNGQAIGQANGGEGIFNDLNGKSSSGDVKNSFNTGASEDPSVMTGNAWSGTEITNQGNANVFGHAVSPISFPWIGSNSNVTLTFSLQDLLGALGIH